MKKSLLLILIIVIIIAGGVLIRRILIKKENSASLSNSEKNMPQVLKGKKIAIIIAFRGFRDEEYFIPCQILKSQGAEITTFSTSVGQAVGKLGGEAEVQDLIKNLNVDDYEAVLFVGGPGAVKLIDNQDCRQVAREAAEKNKVLGAICIAPAILAKAGVLDGKKATVWSSTLDKSAVKILKDYGAVYQPDSVVSDGRIITANGPSAAKEFAEKIIKTLNEIR
jgi:protease I